MLAKTAVLRRAIGSCNSVTRAVDTLRAIIVADAYSHLLSPRFAAGRVLTKDQGGALLPTRIQIVHSLRKLELTKQILILLERTRPTADLTGTYASALQTMKIHGPAISISPVWASHLGDPDASRRSQQSTTIYPLQHPQLLPHRPLLLRHDDLILPSAAGYSFIESIVPAFRAKRDPHTPVRQSIPSASRTPHSQSMRPALPLSRALRPASITIAVAGNVQRRQNRRNAVTRLQPLRLLLSYHNAAHLLGSAVATLKSAVASAKSVLGRTEATRSQLRVFRRPAPALRGEKAHPLERAWLPPSLLKPLALRNAAMAGALAAALMLGNANGILAQSARATASAPRTAATLSQAQKAKASITINYSPHFTIRAPEAGDNEAISRCVMEVLERHGQELHQILARELVRYQRTEF